MDSFGTEDETVGKLKPLELCFDINGKRLIIYDKETKEEVIIASLGFDGLVYHGRVIYKDTSSNMSDKERHLNLPGIYPWKFKKYIGAAIDKEYIYVQYQRYVVPSYDSHVEWTMRKYKYV